MTTRHRHAWLAIAVGFAGLATTRASLAQDTPAYRDRIIAAQALQPLPPDEDEDVDTSGPPRSLRFDIVAGRSERGDDAFDEAGIAFGGFRQTADWGAFSLDATLFDSDRARDDGIDDRRGGVGGLATLWQRGLYLDGGWRGDNGLGVLNTPSTPLQRSQYRFFLPTVSFAGASSEWQNDRNGLLLQGAIGRAGVYSGTRIVGFEIADGDVASLGAQWNWNPRWSSAVSFLGTQGRIEPDAYGEPVLLSGDTRALYAATAWQGPRAGVQLNLLGSETERGDATGAWLDGTVRRGRYLHNYGAYRLGTDLSWGALPINNDVEGAYYRVAYQYARWSWNAGIDTLHSLSGAGFDGEYGSAFLRYQANATLGYGGSLNVRHATDSIYSAQLFLDKSTGWGQTRVQLDQAGSDRRSDSWQVSVDQAFPLRQGTRLSTSLAYGSLRYEGEPTATKTTSVALYGGRDLTDRLSLDGSARWTQGSGGSASRGTDVNVGLNWRASARWSVTTAYYQSQGSQRSPFVLDPLVTETPYVSLPRDRSLFVSVRYERSAGRLQAAFGGAAGGPTGSIAGSLFLDDNGDGVRSASEQPAANVTVLLDGRFAVRTDSLGQFEFPRVSVGAHAITVVPDNLPLPWFVDANDAQRTVQVTVRQQARVDIGARRQR